MNPATLRDRAELLRSEHAPGRILVLPNVWDALSAVLTVRAGSRAIATTSAGIAWAAGYQDSSLARSPSARMGRAEMLDAVGRIVRVVDVPVTVDVEDGYGSEAHEVAETVRQVVASGAVGINLEDTGPAHDAVLDIDVQRVRLAAARRSAEESGLPNLVLNARTDVHVVGSKDVAETIERGRAYAGAGADCFFVPGLLDLDALASLSAAIPVPVNAMAVPDGPTIAQLAEAGVRRVSVGSAVQQAAYAAAVTAVEELLGPGTLHGFGAYLGIREMNALLPGTG